jgi:hypothetical protein
VRKEKAGRLLRFQLFGFASGDSKESVNARRKAVWDEAVAGILF